MTSAQLVERTLRRIVPAPPLNGRTSLRTALSALVTEALRLLPIRVREKMGDTEAEIYRKDFTVALTSGQGSLASHTNLALASEPMISEEIVKVTHPDAITSWNTTGKLQRVGSEGLLSLPRSMEFAYYAVEDNILYTMMNNERTTLGSNATVRAAYSPALSTVKPSHEFLLIECLLELAGVVTTKAA